MGSYSSILLGNRKKPDSNSSMTKGCLDWQRPWDTLSFNSVICVRRCTHWSIIHGQHFPSRSFLASLRRAGPCRAGKHMTRTQPSRHDGHVRLLKSSALSTTLKTFFKKGSHNSHIKRNWGYIEDNAPNSTKHHFHKECLSVIFQFTNNYVSQRLTRNTRSLNKITAWHEPLTEVNDDSWQNETQWFIAPLWQISEGAALMKSWATTTMGFSNP